MSLPPPSLPASVIVCTHNGSRVIEETLESLVRQDFPPEAFEILVVDNASTDATPEVVRGIAGRHPGRIRLVPEPVLGHSSARNRGIQESRGDVIAFTDDDARVSPRWLRALVDTCERPRVGCAGGPVRAVLEGPLPEWVTPLFLPYLALFDKGREEVELSYNEYPRGVNMAYPRQSFREVGLFSTAFGLKGRSLLYYDEIELCYRLERLGPADPLHARRRGEPRHPRRTALGRLVQAAVLLAGEDRGLLRPGSPGAPVRGAAPEGAWPARPGRTGPPP